jgi:hypothetical protein
MTNFKIGDKVRIRKLSEKEFEEVYHRDNFSYKTYLNYYSKYFDNAFIVGKLEDRLIDLVGIEEYFYPEELEKAYSLKDKLNLIKELIK